MFREMRRKDKELSREETLEILKNGEYGVLSTTGEDGYAYGVPLNYFFDGVNIYLHCAIKGQKLDNIAFSDRVSFCVVGRSKILPEKFTTDYESAVAFGRARLAKGSGEGSEKRQAIADIASKYSHGLEAKAAEYIKKAESVIEVIVIEVEHLTGKRH